MTTSTPSSPHGSALGSRSDSTSSSSPSTEMPVFVALIVVRQHPEHRVVLQEVRHRLERPEVVDGDEVDVGATLLGGPEEVAADAAEAVDADANGHRGASFHTRRVDRSADASRGSRSRTCRSSVRDQCAQVAVDDARIEPPRRQPAGQLLGHRHRSVPPARAADRHRQVALALGLVVRQEQVEQVVRTARGTRPPQGGRSTYSRTGRSRPVSGRSPRPSAGSGRNRTSITMSASSGRPFLNPNDSMATCNCPAVGFVAAERGDEPRLQLVDVEVGRVDDQIGVALTGRASARSSSIASSMP